MSRGVTLAARRGCDLTPSPSLEWTSRPDDKVDVERDELMASVVIAGAPARDRLLSGLFAEGVRLMRERWPVYAFFAVVCAVAAALPVRGDPVNLLNYPVFRVWFGCAVLAIFFILPTAIRRLRPDFRMTVQRGLLTALVLVSISFVTDLGIMAAVIPGLIVGVLLSQGLVVALIQSSEKPSVGGVISSIKRAFGASFALTRGHFATTLGVVTLSLAILIVPIFLELIAMIVFYVRLPQSLYAVAPLLYLSFIYLECVRYTLIVRWFRRLQVEPNAGVPFLS
jgi:hypothetical protein